MSSTPLEKFATALAELATAELPDAVVHEARRCLLNVVGTSIGASRTPEADGLVGVLATLGAPELTVLGRAETLDRYGAAEVLGFAAHFDDFDDTHLATVIHPGAATMGALVPLGVLGRVDPARSLVAMALGVEAQLRVGLAMSPSHYDLGWHITGTCGVVGAATAAGVALGASAERLASGIALSLSMTLGHREAFGTPVKPFHAGKAAANGLLAASLAAHGIDGAPSLLTEDGGYFDALSDEWSLDWLDPADLSRRWAILDTTYKPFPCGIVAHPAIEAAIGLHDGLDARTVERVEVGCNPLVPELMGRREVTTGLEARFCAIHGVAVGLLVGRGGLAEFSDAMATDPSVVELRDRTFLVPDERFGRDAAEVRVELSDGSTRAGRVEVAAGSRARPLTDAELLHKFEALVDPVLPGRAAAIADAAMGLGTQTSIADVAAEVHA